MNEGKDLEIQRIDEKRVREQIQNLTHLAIKVHQNIIKEIGGMDGIRDQAALDSAIATPFATFFYQDLHETVFDKAAALMRSLSLDHPFNDGNKRTSLVITAVFLLEHAYGFKEEVEDDEIVDFCIAIAEGKKDVLEIANWLRENTNGASAKSFKKAMERMAQA